MTVRPLAFQTPINVIVSTESIEPLNGRPLDLIQELTQLATGGVLPARLEPGNRLLRLYGRRQVAGLYLTRDADAYRLGFVSARNFRDEQNLLREALLLHGPGFIGRADVREIPRQYPATSYWRQLNLAWADVLQRTEPEPPAPIAAHHAAYLDLVAQVIAASRDIETAKQEAAEPLHYVSRSATREVRYSARGIYVFTLADRAQVTPGSMVYLNDERDLRGRVKSLDGLELVIGFETAVDYQRIPPQGTFRVLPSDRVHRAQLAAVEMFRKGTAANPALLDALVDARFQPYRAEAAPSRRALHPGQAEAFARALAVPDLLLVLGPPVTGKTTTITEIVAGSAARRQRVLVTSHTNRAVDNVLEGLPTDLRAVRLGSADAVTGPARAYLVESQVETVRGTITTGVGNQLERLAAVLGADDPVGRWLDWLTQRRAEARAAEARLQHIDAQREAAVGAVSLPLIQPRQLAERADLDAQRAIQALEGSRLAAAESAAAAQRRGSVVVVGFWYRWLAGRRERRVEELTAELEAARVARKATARYLADLDAQIGALIRADPEISRLVGELHALSRERTGAVADVMRSADMVRDQLRPFGMLDGPVPSDLTGWGAFEAAARGCLDLLRRRAAVLTDWRDRVSDAGKELSRELVRYADVVAATCIGTATTDLLSDLDVDLAVVDEAGQVSTQNLLVPLARSRRAVLVGDHRQLPPYLDEDVRQWATALSGADELTAAEIANISELLAKSGFERLFDRTGRANSVVLTLQHRMPAEVAQFVSAQFYSNMLTTSHPGGLDDPLFTSPFAMVDTADRAERERAERQRGRRETWQQPGYVNELEADLITDLAEYYASRHASWAVIAPYRAQVDLITRRLRARLGAAALGGERVGTVDSFQGGERDVILYGFTRSNPAGKVGFLKEVRRVNVAITRARRQLVLVGDTKTLRKATEPEFEAMVRALLDHLAAAGDLQPSRVLTSRLSALEATS